MTVVGQSEKLLESAYENIDILLKENEELKQTIIEKDKNFEIVRDTLTRSDEQNVRLSYELNSLRETIQNIKSLVNKWKYNLKARSIYRP